MAVCIIYLIYIKIQYLYIQQCCPLGSSYLVGKVLKYRFIEFFVFDYDSPSLLVCVFSS